MRHRGEHLSALVTGAVYLSALCGSAACAGDAFDSSASEVRTSLPGDSPSLANGDEEARPAPGDEDSSTKDQNGQGDELGSTPSDDLGSNSPGAAEPVSTAPPPAVTNPPAKPLSNPSVELEVDAGSPSKVDAATRCVPTSCETEGKDCGTLADGCDGTLDCGICAPGSICGEGEQANRCVCEPKSCAVLGAECGQLDDGCGGILDCGGCAEGKSCGALDQPNRCGCEPRTCEQLGKDCGQVDNGCGVSLACGSCVAPQSCGTKVANVCSCPEVQVIKTGFRTPKKAVGLGLANGHVSKYLAMEGLACAFGDDERTCWNACMAAGGSTALCGATNCAGGVACRTAPVWTNLSGINQQKPLSDTPQIAFRPSTYYDALQFTHFGFKLPPQSKVVGAKLRVQRWAKGTRNAGVYDEQVRLTTLAHGQSGNRAKKNLAWPAQPETKTYGGSEDSWGLNMNRGIVNDAEFGVVIQAQPLPAREGLIAYLDEVALELEYFVRCQ